MQQSELTAFAREQGFSVVPRHVGVIMDGSGRWAKRRGLPRVLGHRSSMETLRGIIRTSSDLGVEALSLYAFSTENWKRPKDEVSALMDLLVEFLQREIQELHENHVKIRFMGEVDAFPPRVYDAIQSALAKTKDNTGLIVNIALNYGGRAELARAAKRIAQQVAEGKLSVEDIDEKTLEANLYTAGLPEMDVLIRTSGEMRLSNFMLYQCSYTEFYFPETLWPDFGPQEYMGILKQFQSRDRRFGGVK